MKIFYLSVSIIVCSTLTCMQAAALEMKLPINPYCQKDQIDFEGNSSNSSGCNALHRSKWLNSTGPSEKQRQLLLDKYSHGDIEYITYHHAGTVICNEEKGYDCVTKEGAQHPLLPKKLIAELDNRDVSTAFRKRVSYVTSGHLKKAKGWGEVAYHYIVDTHGNVAEARSVEFAPATGTFSYGAPVLDAKGVRQQHDFRGHLAVMITGNYDYQKLSDDGRLALIRVMSEGQRAFKVKTQNILPHRHHANSTCPGKNILKYKDKFPRWVQIFSIQMELFERGCMPEGTEVRTFLDGLTGRLTRTAFKNLRLSDDRAPKYSISDSTLFRLIDNSRETAENRWMCK